MTVLLVNSPLFYEAGIPDDGDYLPPIGLGLIATYLINHNVPVEMLDALFHNISVDNLKLKLEQKQPDFIGINIFTTNYEIVRNIVESIDFRTHILIGGLATKELYKEILKWKNDNRIDIIIGDGELITCDIVKNVVKEEPFIVHENRRVYKVSPSSMYFISDISDMGLIRSLFTNEPSINHFGEIEAHIVTSRGCINNCTFCAASRSMNKDFPVRERSESSIINEIAQLTREYPNIKSIRILDDLFLKSKFSIAKAISIFSQFDLVWRSMAHVSTFNHVSQNDIVALHRSGCKELFIGIESGSSRILGAMKKGNDRERIIRNLEMLFMAHIEVKGYFIYGFPGETESDMMKTFDLASELCDLALKYRTKFRTSVFQFRPYHGSEIFSILNQKFDLNRIHMLPDLFLTNLIGRGQFNFYSGNFSDSCLETIHDYICKTNDLNGSRTYSKQNQRFRKSDQRKKMQSLRALP